LLLLLLLIVIVVATTIILFFLNKDEHLGHENEINIIEKLIEKFVIEIFYNDEMKIYFQK
jgi:hypothetical protein